MYPRVDGRPVVGGRVGSGEHMILVYPDADGKKVPSGMPLVGVMQSALAPDVHVPEM